MKFRKLSSPVQISIIIIVVGITGAFLWRVAQPTMVVIQDLEGETEQTGTATFSRILYDQNEDQYPYTRTVVTVRFHDHEYPVRVFYKTRPWQTNQSVQITYRDAGSGHIFVDKVK